MRVSRRPWRSTFLSELRESRSYWRITSLRRGRPERAIEYWLKAGERDIGRSANFEAVRHLTRGLDALRTLPESTERDHRELAFQIAIGGPLIAVHGYSAPQTGAGVQTSPRTLRTTRPVEPLCRYAQRRVRILLSYAAITP